MFDHRFVRPYSLFDEKVGSLIALEPLLFSKGCPIFIKWNGKPSKRL